MKKIKFDGLPAGSVVLTKRYSIWKRLWAKLTKKDLPYNMAYVDPFGESMFIIKDGLCYRYNVVAFIPKKNYSKQESAKLLEHINLFAEDPAEMVLGINLVRPKTLVGATLEEMFEDNKYYTKKVMK